MKNALWIALPLAALIISCGTARQGTRNELLEKYVSAQEALAADDLSKAKAALGSLADISQGELQELSRTSAEAADLESARAAFKPLSELLGQGELPGGYAEVFCPMADSGKGAPWIQKTGQVQNPYYGTAMLSCGVIKRTGNDRPK